MVAFDTPSCDLNDILTCPGGAFALQFHTFGQRPRMRGTGEETRWEGHSRAKKNRGIGLKTYTSDNRALRETIFDRNETVQIIIIIVWH